MTHVPAERSVSDITALRLPNGVTLVVVRHGETDWNKAQRYQGQTDIPLNDTGRGQAARNGRALRDIFGDKVFDFDFVASPLSRTAETMRIARQSIGLDPDHFVRDDRLKEQHFGHWEGLVWADLPRLDPDGFAARKADTWNWMPRGGENYPMLSARVSPWLATVERDTICVTHGNVSRTIRGLLLPIPKTDIPKLEVPQDKVWRFIDGHGVWL